MIERVARILESFSSTRVAQTPSDIARRSSLPNSTAHRLVAELVDAGLLEREENGAVRIGMRLWELTTRGSHALGLRQIAMPFMEEVQARVKEHTQLGVLEQDEVLFIERLSERGAGANITKIAGRLPLNASSSGLVLLAFAPTHYQNRILEGDLKALSRETITEPEALRRKLAEIRKMGYAYAPGTVEKVSTGIAVPVSDANGVIAALSVVLPRAQEGDAANATREHHAIAALKEAAAGMTKAITEVRFTAH
jgi:DNA-binding IclR family transcriptional regulator